jgi:hypothetical protein
VHAARRIGQFVTETLDAADATAKMADRLGLTLEELQTFEGFAVTAGSSAKGMATGLRTLAKNAEDFRTGTGEAADAFRTLGIEVEGAGGQLKPLGDLTEESFTKLAEMEDATQRVAFAQRLFGRSGTELLPNLRGGADAVRENIKYAKELAVVFDETGSRTSELANNELYVFQRQMLGLRFQLVKLFLPTLRKTVMSFALAAKRAREWAAVNKGTLMGALKSAGLTAFLGTLGAIVKRFGGIRGVIRAIMPWVNRLFFAFMRFIIPFLIIDDFFAFLDGRKSVIGTLLQEFGLVDDAVKSGKELKKAIQSWIPAIKKAIASITRFFTESAIGFGALMNLFFDGNKDNQAIFESTFAKNTNTIQAFFDWIGTNITSYLYAPFKWALEGISWLFVWLATGALRIIQGIGSVLTQVFTGAIRIVGNAVAWLVSWIDMLFGTNLAGAVKGATDNIVKGFDSAWKKASAGISGLVKEIQNTGRMIKNLITDPIGEAAKIATGSTDEEFEANIASINEMNRKAAAQRSARRSGQAITVNNNQQTTVQVTPPPGAGVGGFGRAIAAGVARSNAAQSNKATLAAVR